MPPIPKIPRVHLAYEIICSFEQNMYATVATPPAKIIGNSTIITKQTRCNKTDCLKKFVMFLLISLMLQLPAAKKISVV